MYYTYGYGMTTIMSYGLVIIGAVISLIASLYLKAVFAAYSKKTASNGITAERAAQTILQWAGITDVRIERISGNLTDHYSPTEKVLRLSDSVYGSNSIAAIGVAAHECGHAIQHDQGYAALKLRSVAVPVANIGSKFSWPVVILGLVLGNTQIAEIGAFLFCFVVLFQLITLPVEFNASRRAIKVLDENCLLYDKELRGAKKVLFAAAMTYVAALANTILQLLRILLIINSRRNRR